MRRVGLYNQADLPFNSYDLTRLNGFDVREASGYVRQQVFQAVRFRAENDDSDASASQILLVFNALVHRDENVKFSAFRCREKIAVRQTRESSVTRGLAIVAREIIPESLVNTFVE
jgi:hypothetical protein